MDFASSPWLWDSGIPQPTFERDFARDKELDRGGIGPAITFTRASNATYFDSNGVMQLASEGQPRFDHDPSTLECRGLLIEEQRVNSVKNSQLVGAVAGTTGTMPNEWFFTYFSVTPPLTGLTRTISLGTESGLSYIDIRVQGTPSSSGTVGIYWQGAGGVAATSGQKWTSSLYVKRSAGSMAGISSVVHAITRNAAGSFLGNTPFDTFTPASPSENLAAQRKILTTPTTEATTAFVVPFLDINLDGNPVDITLRIAAPQLEQGAFPTSYIPTTSAAVTRSADSAVVTPISGFYNASEGTLFAEWNLVNLSGGRSVLVAGNASGGENRLLIQARETTNTTRHMAFIDGVAEVALDFATFVAGTAKSALAYAAGNYAATRNGASVLTSSHGAVPSMSALRMGAATIDGNEPLNGHIRRIAYYPKRLSNALLQSLTT